MTIIQLGYQNSQKIVRIIDSKKIVQLSPRTRTNVSPRIKKKITSIDIPIINGKVMNKQKGQQGPAITIGVPSDLDIRANMLPIRFAQQQQ